jgi:type I restriction enzyme S subunit
MNSSTSTETSDVKTLGDFISLQRGTTYKSALLGQPGAVLIGLASIEREGGFRNDKLETYGGECPKKISLKPGDLYVSLKDITHDGHLLGAVARIPDFIERGRLTQDTVKLVFEKELFPRNYIYWLLRTPQYRNYCRSRQTGTTNLGLSREDFLSLRVPPMTEATNAIVIALESIEKKIENLRKQNNTLEAIAQTLFKHWFVDFEFPNEDGKPYNSSGGEMVRSELGEIPAGWRVGRLEDICKIINGFAFKSEDYRDDGIKIVRTKNFNEAGFIESNDLVYISKTQLKKYKSFELQKFDFLMVMVGASISKFVTVTSHILPALQNQNMWNFRSINKENQLFLNYSLKNLINQHSKSATGSAREFFRKDYFYQISIILPSDMTIKAFSNFCLRIALRVDLNIKQIQTLIKTRDVLLPKLMSGKLRITE